MSWPGTGVADYFKANRLYPIRPEELSFQPENKQLGGLRATIKDKQFLGRETRYIVSALGTEIEIISHSPHAAEMDEEVYITKH